MVNSNREDPDRKPRLTEPAPLSGAYYWVPSPRPIGVVWNLKTCHDLGGWDGISHREFWPYVLEVLADAWGKDAETLKHHLRDHYTGLPRGRIVHRKSGCVIIHGDDAPAPDWLDLVKSRFRLTGVEAAPEFAEHETMQGDDPKRLQAALGVSFRPNTPRRLSRDGRVGSRRPGS